MTNTRLVGLAGLAGSGKDSAAQALIECGWERRAFADSLRSFLLALDPIVGPSNLRLRGMVQAYGWDKTKRFVPEVRKLLQRCGVEAGRAVLGEDVWVNATLDDLPNSTASPVVVTDVRFPNEVRAIRERGGIVVRINRPGIETLTDEHGKVHVSETALAGTVYDAEILNDAELVDLHAAIRNIAYNPCASVTKGGR